MDEVLWVEHIFRLPVSIQEDKYIHLGYQKSFPVHKVFYKLHFPIQGLDHSCILPFHPIREVVDKAFGKLHSQQLALKDIHILLDHQRSSLGSMAVGRFHFRGLDQVDSCIHHAHRK